MTPNDPNITFENWRGYFTQGNLEIFNNPVTPLYLVQGDLDPKLLSEAFPKAYVENRLKHILNPQGLELVTTWTRNWWNNEIYPSKKLGFLADLAVGKPLGSPEHRQALKVARVGIHFMNCGYTNPRTLILAATAAILDHLPLSDNLVKVLRKLPTSEHSTFMHTGYKAFLDADAMAKWLPPHGFTGRVHHLDARVGGTYKMGSVEFQVGCPA